MLALDKRTRWIVGLAASVAYFVLAEWSRRSFVDPAPKGKVVIQLLRPFEMHGKAAVVTDTPATNTLGEFADDEGVNDRRSPVVIYENGRPLGPAHSSYADICDYGMGRFSFWRHRGFVFTASDDSNPNTNRRTYWAVLPENTTAQRDNIRPGRPAYTSPGASTGKIIKIDQDNGKITLEHKKGGIVGDCPAAMLVDIYNIGDGLTFSALKVGDPVVFTEAQIGGVWTVTKIQKR